MVLIRDQPAVICENRITFQDLAEQLAGASDIFLMQRPRRLKATGGSGDENENWREGMLKMFDVGNNHPHSS